MTCRYLSNRFDEAAILATFIRLAFTANAELVDQDYAVIAALRRSSPSWDLPIPEIAERLSNYHDDQISGLVNNVKGILHEIEFQIFENEDGDSVYAALFPNTNHKGVDVRLFEENTGESWDIQLKATDSISDVNAWIDSNPDTQILVTEEIAERMGIPSSGFSNKELEIRVQDFVDRMIDVENDAPEALWDNFPILLAASSGIIVFELWRRFRNHEITFEEFKKLLGKTLGIKTAKYIAIFSALGVPGLNVVVSTFLLTSLVLSVGELSKKSSSWKPLSFLKQIKI